MDTLPFLPTSNLDNVDPVLSKGLSIINSMRGTDYIEISSYGFALTNKGIDYIFAKHTNWVVPLLKCQVPGTIKEQLQERTGLLVQTAMDKLFNENMLIHNGLREHGYNYSVLNETAKKMNR